MTNSDSAFSSSHSWHPVLQHTLGAPSSDYIRSPTSHHLLLVTSHVIRTKYLTEATEGFAVAHSSRAQTAPAEKSQPQCAARKQRAADAGAPFFLPFLQLRPPAHGTVSLYPTAVCCWDYVPAAPTGVLSFWPCCCGFHIALGVVLPEQEVIVHSSCRAPIPAPAALHERGVTIFPTTCESAGPGLSSLIPSSTTLYQLHWSPCCSCCSPSCFTATAPLLRSISHGSRQLSLFLDLWSHVTLSESSPLTTLCKTATLSAFSMPLKVCFSAPEVLFCHYCPPTRKTHTDGDVAHCYSACAPK